MAGGARAARVEATVLARPGAPTSGTSLADRIERSREALAEAFAREVGRSPSARDLSRLLVIDSFPTYLDALAATLRSAAPGETGLDEARTGIEDNHVYQRIRLGYDRREVEAEYERILRLVEGLGGDGPPPAEELERLRLRVSVAADGRSVQAKPTWPLVATAIGMVAGGEGFTVPRVTVSVASETAAGTGLVVLARAGGVSGMSGRVAEALNAAAWRLAQAGVTMTATPWERYSRSRKA